MENSKFEDIVKYKELLDLGIISESEFEAKKAELLNLGKKEETGPAFAKEHPFSPVSEGEKDTVSQITSNDNKSSTNSSASEAMLSDARNTENDGSLNNNRTALKEDIPQKNKEVRTTNKKKTGLILTLILVVLAAALIPFAISSSRKNSEFAKEVESRFIGLSFSYHTKYNSNSSLDIGYSFGAGNTFTSTHKFVSGRKTISNDRGTGTYRVSVSFGKITLTVTDSSGSSQSFSVEVNSSGVPTKLIQGDLTMRRA